MACMYARRVCEMGQTFVAAKAPVLIPSAAIDLPTQGEHMSLQRARTPLRS